MIPIMKNNMKYIAFLFMALFIVMTSCAGMREKKAENHQPFGPHKNKKPHHGHP